MLLIRIMNLNTSSVFLFLSYTPLLSSYLTWLLVIIIGFTMWTHYINILLYVMIFILLAVCIIFLFIDNSFDTQRGLMEVTSLNRVNQYMFLWFVSSEFALFSAFFYGVFSTSLLMVLEFNFSFLALPLGNNNIFIESGYVFFWFFLDIFNIIINTLLLFVSGLFMNVFLMFTYNRMMILAITFLAFSIFFGLAFVWNQLWEFNLLELTITTNVFCTCLFTIDMLHFLHVTYGIIFMCILFLKTLNFSTSDSKIILIICTVFYWHFVDLVWFFLLRFIYFDLLINVYLF